MKNQSFLPSTEKISMQKETGITQEKKDSKQHGSLTHYKSKTNQKPTHENEMYISNSNKWYLQKGARGFKQRKECKLQCKKHKICLNAERIQQSNQLHNIQFMAPPSREGAFFLNTLHFHQKVSQKHTKIKIQSLEQGLLGTSQMKLLTCIFEAAPLLAHWI